MAVAKDALKMIIKILSSTPTHVINLHEVLFYIFNGPFVRGGTHIAIHRDILKGIKPQKIYTTFTVVEDKLYAEK